MLENHIVWYNIVSFDISYDSIWYNIKPYIMLHYPFKLTNFKYGKIMLNFRRRGGTLVRFLEHVSYFHQTFTDGAYWHTSGQNRLGCWNWARNIRNWWRFSDAGRGLGFWYRLTFLKQVPFDDHFKVIVRSIFIKRRWMMHLVILIQLNGLDAESDP